VMGPPGGICSAHGKHTFTARAGHHLPPNVLSSGRNVFEELGTDYTLLAFGVSDSAVEGFEAAVRALKVPLKVVRDSYGQGLEAYESELILVRPDQYVAWCGDVAPADVAAMMRKVVGAV
jgi:4-hydroxyisophthalate hydroxylase